MSDQVSFVVELAVEPGKLEEFKQLMKELVQSAQAEAGTLAYEFFVSDDGGTVFVCERYADSAAVLAHSKTVGEKFGARLMAASKPRRFLVFGSPTEEAKRALGPLGPTFFASLGGFAR